MAPTRRAEIRRLIEWTGERCVPWSPDIQVVYEHYHRYLWAAELVRGRRVLDLGSGEGFGSAILAGTAEHVLGIDVAATAVEHSRLNHCAPNLEFQVGSALDLEALDGGRFGAIVCFELIEHVHDHERVLAGIEHVLAPEGLLVLSTPERRVYSDATGQRNPFHERELSEPELRDLLGTRFEHLRMWGQRTIAGSHLEPIDAPTDRPTTLTRFLARDGEGWRSAGPPDAMYLLAIASHAALPAAPSESLLADPGLELASAHEREAARARDALASAHEDAAAARAEVAVTREEIAVTRDTLERSFDQVAERERQLQHLRELRAADAAALKRMRESVVWAAFERAQQRVYRSIGGRESTRGRAIQHTIRGTGRLLARVQAVPVADTAPPDEIRFADVALPVASLIVTAHRGAEITSACLESIMRRTDGPAYEVIVVDDAGDEANARLWERVSGATVLVNDDGIGYLRSVNRGAAAARGRYLVLMNNDVEVQIGWLRALVRRADRSADVGAVAPKLLYPDGRLQEAGAIVFEDGSGWNYGRGIDPEAPEVNYAREIDYGSAACLLVRRDLFADLGGYDERYLPMYYEDTDLCFALRDRGQRVMFEPTARVVHHEGATAGTDVSTGAKRYQQINRPKFVAKWRTQLERGHLRNSPSNVRRASARATGPHVLVVDHCVPTPDQDSGSLRITRVMEMLVALGCRVTFLADDQHRHEPYTAQLQAREVEVLYGPLSIPAELEAIGRHLKLAILSRPYVAARYTHLVREHAPGARVVYDTVDLHYVREHRRAQLGVPAAASKAASMRELELGLVRGSDATLVVTSEERAEILTAVPEANVVVVPNANEIADTVAPPDRRAGVLFIGGFRHPPNVDAAIHLIADVMPLVWQELDDVPVVIAGPDAPAEIQGLASPRVDVAGWVEDLQPLLAESRVMAAPLRYGAGMKGKVTQSLGAGLPVVTTSIGAEGLGAQDGRDLLVADDAAGLAERIVALHRDDGLWRRLSAAGQEVVERTASHAIMRRQLSLLLERCD